MPTFSFELIARCGKGRAGILHTPHGDVETPVFMPVGTQATVKALTPAQIEDTGARLILANTYHLYLRPGEELIAEMGGLHKFMSWPHTILTDSGGFQVFSLAEIRKIDEDGATFKSHIDGSMHRLTPEKSVAIQEKLGADIIMAFDECAPPYDKEYNQRAMERTHNWALRCKEAHQRTDQALYGIVQGGIFPDLRTRSAEFISGIGFPGYAIGGLSVGETKEEMHQIIDLVIDILPKDKPRYLMGVGSPEDLINGVMRGIDQFDCVLPTRLARHQAVFTRTGRLNLMNATYAHDFGPIEAGCNCYTCTQFSRAYLRHLIIAKEMLAATLLSIHNVYILEQMMREMRQVIIEGTFEQYANDFLSKWNQ